MEVVCGMQVMISFFNNIIPTRFKSRQPDKPLSIGFLFPGDAVAHIPVHDRDGWLFAAEELGYSHASYFPEILKLSVRDLVRMVNKGKHDVVIVNGGDHHQDALHATEEARSAWRKLKAKTVCVCTEAILQSGFPRSIEKTQSALETFDYFAYTDDLSESLFHQSGKPSLWMPQYVDKSFILETVVPREKIKKAYFRGKIMNWGFEGVYTQRRILFEGLKDHPDIVMEEGYKPHLTGRELLDRKVSYAFYLQLPSNHPGFVLSFLEAAALGLPTFHHELHPDSKQMARMFTPGVHFLPYRTDDIEDLKVQVQNAVKEVDSPEFKKMGSAVRELILSQHTVTHRLKALVDLANRA